MLKKLKVLRLLKYVEHLEVLETVGAAIVAGTHGDDFTVTRDVSVKSRLKTLMISLHDKYVPSHEGDPFDY